MPEPIIVRAFASEFSRPDRTTLEARLVPYGVRQEVVDITPDGLDSYVEEISPAMFAAQVHAGHPQTLARVKFLDGHPDSPVSGGQGTKMGWAISLRSDDNWLTGVFKLLPSRVADIEAMLESGISDMSVGFIPLANGTVVRADGSRLRTRGHLDHVALEPQGAYPGAQVVAMRAKAEAEADERVTHEQTIIERDELTLWLAEQENKQGQYASKLRP